MSNCLKLLLLIVLTTVFYLATSPAGAVTVIKTAMITPEGSTWTNMLYQMAAEIKTRSKGEIEFKIYAGGVSGDESDVLRKMRVNQMHAAGFSGVGLGIIVPQIRVLEAPLLFENYNEVDLIKAELFEAFSTEFEKKGYVLLGFAEAGFVYLFSKKEISSSAGLRETKMWVWRDDPVAEAFLKTFGLQTNPLHPIDVNTGLETGLIDSFYAPPLGAVAFQWYSRIQYMLDYPIVNSTGALILKKKVFDRLSAENRAILKEAAGKYCKELVRLSRRDNKEALAILKESGIAFLTPERQQIELFRENAKTIHHMGRQKLYSEELFNKVEGILKAYRKSRKAEQ
jgi:TRAP-type C4-dicarboxylate transport system substrate-binding protein